MTIVTEKNPIVAGSLVAALPTGAVRTPRPTNGFLAMLSVALALARQLKERAYGVRTKDVRECHRALLIQNKQQVARPKDLEDLEFLKKLRTPE